MTDDGRRRPTTAFRRPPGPPAPRLSERVRLAGLRAIGPLYRRSSPRPLNRGVGAADPARSPGRHAVRHAVVSPAARGVAARQDHVAGGTVEPGVVAGNPDLDELLICRLPGLRAAAEAQRSRALSAAARHRARAGRPIRHRGRAPLRSLVGRLVGRRGRHPAAHRLRSAGDTAVPHRRAAVPVGAARGRAERDAGGGAGAGHRPADRARCVLPSARRTARGQPIGCRPRAPIRGRPLVAIHPGRRRGRQAVAGEPPGPRWPTGWPSELDVRIVLTGGERAADHGRHRRRLARAAAWTRPGQTTSTSSRRCSNAARWRSARIPGRCTWPWLSARRPSISTARFRRPNSGRGAIRARHVVLKTNWPCAPCNRLDWPAAELAQHACMAAITPDDVVRAAVIRVIR